MTESKTTDEEFIISNVCTMKPERHHGTIWLLIDYLQQDVKTNPDSFWLFLLVILKSSEHGFLLVAFESKSNTLAGYICGDLENCRYEILLLDVVPKFRFKHVGSKLTKAAEDLISTGHQYKHGQDFKEYMIPIAYLRASLYAEPFWKRLGYISHPFQQRPGDKAMLKFLEIKPSTSEYLCPVPCNMLISDFTAQIQHNLITEKCTTPIQFQLFTGYPQPLELRLFPHPVRDGAIISRVFSDGRVGEFVAVHDHAKFPDVILQTLSEKGIIEKVQTDKSNKQVYRLSLDAMLKINDMKYDS